MTSGVNGPLPDLFPMRVTCRILLDDPVVHQQYIEFRCQLRVQA